MARKKTARWCFIALLDHFCHFFTWINGKHTQCEPDHNGRIYSLILNIIGKHQVLVSPPKAKSKHSSCSWLLAPAINNNTEREIHHRRGKDTNFSTDSSLNRPESNAGRNCELWKPLFYHLNSFTIWFILEKTPLLSCTIQFWHVLKSTSGKCRVNN